MAFGFDEVGAGLEDLAHSTSSGIWVPNSASTRGIRNGTSTRRPGGQSPRLALRPFLTDWNEVVLLTQRRSQVAFSLHR
jgi:hypothetical protein